jgi:hypothetical protein
MTDQPHGHYFAQELMLDQDTEAREQIQDALDAAERKEWHLVGVSDVPQTGGTILFWDTTTPSFGRTPNSGSRTYPKVKPS